MSETWPGTDARERYVRFLELELLLMDRVSRGELDTAVLEELNELLRSSFPRAADYIRRKLETGSREDAFNEVNSAAWIEAHSVADGEGGRRLSGKWTQKEIAEDIKSCFDEARRNVGL
jgi:hypothetical protein